MADAERVELQARRHVSGATVVTATGTLSRHTAAGLRRGLAKLFAEGAPVLLDVSGLRLAWVPAAEVLVTALATAGGWPLARMVVFGADAPTAERLRASRVADSVPLALDAAAAAELVDVRPVRVSRTLELPADAGAVRQAVGIVGDTCDQWAVARRHDAERVVAELAANAVAHAGTPFRLRLVLDATGLRVSVRDAAPPSPQVTTSRSGFATEGHGLATVARLSRTWGVLRYADGTAVWAHLPLARPLARPTAPARRPQAAWPHPGPPLAGVVSVPRRRRLVTSDAELAHAFLRSVWGAHTLHLPDAGAGPGFLLDYDGIATNRFAVECVGHPTRIEGLFLPTDGLVVARPLAGELTVTRRREELHVGPGDLVVWGTGADTLVSSAGVEVEVVRLAPEAVARVAAELTGVDAPTLPFGLSRPVSAARAAHWCATLTHLRRDVLGDSEVLAGALTRKMIFKTLVAMLVETFPNPTLDALTGGADGSAAPPTVRRAVRFIEDHAGDDIGLAAIAAAAGVGARGLQLAFRRHHGTTPLEYLRRVRLARAHRDLQAGSPGGTTVGAVADRWRFPHHGNFSAAYLRTYGRSPSVTLRSGP